MKIVRYNVRAIKDGKVVLRRTFKVESKALDVVRGQMRRGRRVIFRKEVEKVPEFRIITDWGNTTTRPVAPKPISMLVGHHSVTKQLSPDATVKQEKAEMRNLQSIGFARGLGGFSYGFAIFPSGRVYKGSGWGVVEAATGGMNTPTDSVVLVGNYDVFKPTEPQLDTFVKLGNWGQREGYLTKVITVDPHQKFKATACPGKFTIPELPAIQRKINL